MVMIKKGDLDILAEAHLPSDLFTPTLGSNYGMPGYEDMQYNLGVLEGVADPEYHEPPAVPTGLNRNGAFEGSDMAVQRILDGEEELADLNWLDPTQLQDPARLPENVDMIPELVEAWGVNRRTTGVTVAHQVDLDFANRDKAQEVVELNPRSIEAVLTHAMRRSANGDILEDILGEARLALGEHLPKFANVFTALQEDHGLAGNVFIRVSAYPGYSKGRWKDDVRRSNAHYILASQHEIDTQNWVRDGRCAYTGKQVVSEIPWGDALELCSPRLAAAGIKLASGSPREVLRSGFLAPPTKEAVGRLATFAPHSMNRVEKLGAGNGLSKVASSALRWVRRSMSEGFVGKDLDGLIGHRFADSTLQEAATHITQARKSHEGAAGFLYVDAEAYLTAKGCEEGARRHRANQIPAVAQMSRCSSCTLATKREDGSLKCSAYNKTLVGQWDESELEALKTKNIKGAAMTDAEATSSLFAPIYESDEFGLVNANMEGVEYSDLEAEKMAKITFGDWHI
jgi:hypothetical protein